jgi:hypothetical protein
MTDSTTKAFLQSGDKRHALYVNAFVAVASAGITGFITVYTSPKPVSEERMKEIVASEIAAEIAPLKYRIEGAEKAASEAKTITADINRQVLVSLAAMSDRMSAVAESVARIDERTKKGGT